MLIGFFENGIKMNIRETIGETKRQTVAEDVFQYLRSEIIALRLEPGAKLSEVETAKQCSVSRQPVREAFLRLGEMNLLHIRPQMATRVRKISIREILDTRFIRTAVEIEVCRRACEIVTQDSLVDLQKNLDQQKYIIEFGNFDQFQELDYMFHELLCNAAGVGSAFKTIVETKSHVDRLCTLALQDMADMSEIYRDHVQIYEALVKGDADAIVNLMRFHLARLDETITQARKYHQDFFED